jgi:carbonic anhydrase
MKPVAARILSIALATSLAGTGSSAFAKEKVKEKDTSWSYSGKNGPDHWAKVDKNNIACAEGQAQSPIDIPDKTVRKGDFPSMLFNYHPSPLAVTDTGHSVSAKFAPGSYFTLEGVKYDLLSVEFHKPGEHKVNGKGHEMEAHLVHKGKGDKLAVLVVPLDPGKENPVVKAIASNMPATKGKENSVPSVTINAVDLLPSNKDYYAYMGSATTPPCTENIEWFVLKQPITVGADQVARFAKLYPMNARPTQPINGRDIRGSR